MRRSSLLLLPLLLLLDACSDEQLSFFFDIPPPTAEELAAEAAEAAAKEKEQAAAAALAGGPEQALARDLEQDRPPIEDITTWEGAAEILPKDALDEVDWVAALRQGLIRPRATIDGQPLPESAIFRWDFYFPGPDPTMDAFFPHSAHTEWLACESCHPRIFRYRELDITMDRIFEGEACGVCHGVVAFSLDNCARCHEKME